MTMPQLILLGGNTFIGESRYFASRESAATCSVKNLGLVRLWKIILTAMIMAHCVKYTPSRIPIPITPC